VNNSVVMASPPVGDFEVGPESPAVPRLESLAHAHDKKTGNCSRSANASPLSGPSTSIAVASASAVLQSAATTVTEASACSTGRAFAGSSYANSALPPDSK